jgi:hypothetical protein
MGLSAMDVLDRRKRINFPRSVVEMMQGMLGSRRRLAEGAAEDHPRLRRAQPLKGRRARSCRRSISPRSRKSWPRRFIASRAMSMCSRTCSTRRFPRFRQARAQLRQHLRPADAAFFYGLQSGEEINVEIEPGKTLIIKYLTFGEARDDGDAHGLLRTERPAARSRRAGSLARRQAASPPQGRGRQPQSRPRADAGQGVERDGQERRRREGRRSAALDRSDEDGDGRLLSARSEGRGHSRQGGTDRAALATCWSCSKDDDPHFLPRPVLRRGSG